MEKFNCRSSTTLTKSIGTVVSIAGAIVATLYKGPSLLGNSTHLLTAASSAWLVGALLLTLDSAAAALFIIAQALVIRKCPAVLILMLFYSCFIAIISAAVSFIVDIDLSAWSLNSTARLIPIILSVSTNTYTGRVQIKHLIMRNVRTLTLNCTTIMY